MEEMFRRLEVLENLYDDNIITLKQFYKIKSKIIIKAKEKIYTTQPTTNC